MSDVVEQRLPEKVLTAKTLVPGEVRGPALVCTAPISGWGGIDPKTGTITETTHPQRGESFAGRVLVIPGAKGSSGWSGQFHLARVIGTAPLAIVTRAVNSKLAVGLVVLEIPAVQVTDLDAFVGETGRLPVREVAIERGEVRVTYHQDGGGGTTPAGGRR
ncbi:hypothetical protein GCM10023169_02950 [Georgenia halophila]|uniref:Phosphomevalonate dehydratase small subunit-like domain-containing protein n=1 Tax=Georgenia halophila TaxID=620889 RepID=A0ABP8KUU0_9MICO